MQCKQLLWRTGSHLHQKVAAGGESSWHLEMESYKKKLEMLISPAHSISSHCHFNLGKWQSTFRSSGNTFTLKTTNPLKGHEHCSNALFLHTWELYIWQHTFHTQPASRVAPFSSQLWSLQVWPPAAVFVPRKGLATLDRAILLSQPLLLQRGGQERH